MKARKLYTYTCLEHGKQLASHNAVRCPVRDGGRRKCGALLKPVPDVMSEGFDYIVGRTILNA